MSLVEQQYLAAIDRMSGIEKVQRLTSLYHGIYEMLAFQIGKNLPGLNEREVRRRVAQRLYLSDGSTLELVRKAR